MKAAIERRLTTLEERTKNHHRGITAGEWYSVLKESGVPAPKPLPGERGADYEERIPTESLVSFLAIYEKTSQ